MAKKVLLGTLGYAFLTFLLGVTWHFVLFKDLYHRLGAYNRSEPIIPLGLLSMFLQGVILSSLFRYVHKGARPIQEGIAYALVMGIYMYTTTSLAFAAKTEVSSLGTWLAIQAAFHLIQFVTTGTILGVVFGKKPAPERAA